MTPSDETTEAGKASRMVRRALLHELLQPFDRDPPPPVDMLQAVSRARARSSSRSQTGERVMEETDLILDDAPRE